MKKIFLIVFMSLTIIISYSQDKLYSYDKVNRLVASQSGCSRIIYTYDENGNRLHYSTANISVASSITNSTCSSSGSITLAPPSNSNYSYTWNSGQTSPTITGLIAGIYTVTINDNQNGFSCVQSYTVSAPTSQGSFTVTTKNTSCYGLSDGKAKVNIVNSPSNGHYEYLWNNLTIPNVYRSIDSITGVAEGNYTVSIKNTTDGCVQQLPFTITSPRDIIDNVIIIDNRCLGDTKGSATVKTALASSNYLFSWTGNGLSTGQTTPTISLLPKGTYDVTVAEKAGNHCVANRSVTIKDIRSKEILDISITNPTCEFPLDGMAEALVLSPISNYMFEWFDKNYDVPVGSNSAKVTLPSGNYYLNVTEKTYGCKDTQEFQIQEFALPNSDFVVYPNPTTGIVTIQSCNNVLPQIYYVVSDVSGRRLTEGVFLRFPGQISLLMYEKGEYVISLYSTQSDQTPFKTLRVIKL